MGKIVDECFYCLSMSGKIDKDCSLCKGLGHVITIACDETGKNPVIPKGFPTHTKDITGAVICVGDIIDYDFKGDAPCPFEVVFSDNSFRKRYVNPKNYTQYKRPTSNPLAELEIGIKAITMRLKIIKPAVTPGA